MNKIEYAVKLYVKHLLSFAWINYIFNLFNFIVISALVVVVAREHGDYGPAEVAELSSALEEVYYILLAIPPVGIAIALLAIKVVDKVGFDVDDSDELWPEVTL